MNINAWVCGCKLSTISIHLTHAHMRTLTHQPFPFLHAYIHMYTCIRGQRKALVLRKNVGPWKLPISFAKLPHASISLLKSSLSGIKKNFCMQTADEFLTKNFSRHWKHIFQHCRICTERLLCKKKCLSGRRLLLVKLVLKFLVGCFSLNASSLVFRH